MASPGAKMGSKKAAGKGAAAQKQHPTWDGQASKHTAPDKEGKTKETVMVRVVPSQDLIVNGVKYPAGVEATVGADFAHAHAAVLKGAE